MGHEIDVCRCGAIISRCRCPGPHEPRVVCSACDACTLAKGQVALDELRANGPYLPDEKPCTSPPKPLSLWDRDELLRTIEALRSRVEALDEVPVEREPTTTVQVMCCGECPLCEMRDGDLVCRAPEKPSERITYNFNATRGVPRGCPLRAASVSIALDFGARRR